MDLNPNTRALQQRLMALLLLFILLASSALQTRAQDAPHVIRVGAYQNSPKIDLAPDSTVSGFWPDLLQAIAQQEDWEIQYVPGTWQEGLNRLAAGDIDIMPDVAFTPARAERFAFADPTVLMSWSRIYERRNGHRFDSIRDLDRKTVAALAGSVNLNGPGGLREIVDSFNLKVDYLELPDYDAVFKAVASGAADAGVTNRNYGNKNSDRYHLQKTPLIFQPINMKFALTAGGRRTPYLIARLDANMRQLKQDNDSIYYHLLAEYFEAGIAEREVVPAWLNRFLQGVAIFVIILGLVLVLSRREVARKTRELRLRNEELAAGERRYREIFDSPSDAIFIHEVDTAAVVDVNQAVLDMYCLTREEALRSGVVALSLNEPPYTAVEALAHTKAAREQGPQIFEWRARRGTGELFWAEVSLRLTNIAGQDRVIAVVRDIEDRKKAAAELAAERERLAVTLRSIGDAVITTDINGAVDLMNKIAEQLTGWTASEAAGRPLPEVLKLEDATTGKLRKNLAEVVLESDRIHILPPNTALVARDGRRHLIADSIAPIHDSGSRTIGTVLVFRDITEQARLEKEVLKVKKLESVGVLAGGIAHDFNNILSAILGNLELAKQDLDPAHDTTTLLQTAIKAATRAAGLTKQLLTFSQGGEPIKEAAALPEIIRESAAFVLHGSNVAAHYQFPDDLWLINSDPGQISQVIQNLVLNARHAMPEGGSLEITSANYPAAAVEPLQNLEPGDYVKLTITDHGVGIPASVIDRVFDPFFSTKQEGSGLGLAITHSIIRHHDGHIEVDSKPGQGTCFTIYLPALGAGARKNISPPDILTLQRTGRILVMDDEPELRKVLTRMLEHLGFTTATAANGEEALAAYAAAQDNEAPFDLVIMDLTIPGHVGGQEAARNILALDPTARLIVASGYSNDRVMANFRDYGFVGALAKPASLPKLAQVVDAALA